MMSFISKKDLTVKKTPLIPVQVDARCPNCDGRLLPTGEVKSSHPPKYPHRCKECERYFTLLDRYPKIEYEELSKLSLSMGGVQINFSDR